MLSIALNDKATSEPAQCREAVSTEPKPTDVVEAAADEYLERTEKADAEATEAKEEEEEEEQTAEERIVEEITPAVDSETGEHEAPAVATDS